MGLRRQLPVYSPVRARSLFAGAFGALGVGDPVAALGSRIAGHFGTGDQLLVDSGTSALRIAIEGALIGGSGDTVALPAYCCFDVATAAVGAGAKIRLYDIDPATLGPDWDSLGEVLATDVSAVVVVHLYGIPVDMARVASMAAPSGAIVIEDAAQGIGGAIVGRPLGSIGSLGILSFGRGKGLTGGGGGALLANDEAGRSVLDLVREQCPAGKSGWAGLLRLAAQWLFGRPSLYGIPASIPWLGLGETHYKEPWSPRGIARGHAAALLANWGASLAEAEVRKRNAAEVVAALQNSVQTRTPPVQGSRLRLPILLDADARSVSVMETLTRMGVVAGYPKSLDSIPDVDKSLVGASRNVGASRLADDLMTIPVHSLLESAQLGLLISTMGQMESQNGRVVWHGTGS